MCGDEDFVYKLLFYYIFMNLFSLMGKLQLQLWFIEIFNNKYI